MSYMSASPSGSDLSVGSRSEYQHHRPSRLVYSAAFLQMCIGLLLSVLAGGLMFVWPGMVPVVLLVVGMSCCGTAVIGCVCIYNSLKERRLLLIFAAALCLTGTMQSTAGLAGLYFLSIYGTDCERPWELLMPARHCGEMHLFVLLACSAFVAMFAQTNLISLLSCLAQYKRLRKTTRPKPM